MKWKNGLVSLAIILVLVGVSELFQSPTLFFPEIATLAIGGWILTRQPWQVSKSMLVILMTASALAGVCLVRLPMAMITQVCLAFVFGALALSLTKTSVTPIIATGILPVLMQETSFAYVFSVALSSVVLIAVRHFLEQNEWVAPSVYQPVEAPAEELAHKWLRLLAGLFVVSLLAVLLNTFWIIAPPLIVLLVEFYDPQSRWRRAPLPIWCLLTAGAVAGALCRFLFSVSLGLPLVVSAAFAFVLLFFVFRGFRLFFPLAGSAALFPMLLPARGILWYIPQVAVGAALMMALAFFLSKTQYKKDPRQRDVAE
jgi:hypothetical protein